MEFPLVRMRRLRRTAGLRALVRETQLEPGALVYPLFVCPGEGVRREVSSMPGVFNLSVDEALKEAERAAALGVGGLMLFGLPAEKDELGSGAWAEDGIVQTALRALKGERGLDGLVMIADVCLCEYTSHGHCGVVRRASSGAGPSLGSGPGSAAGVGDAGGGFEIENDASLELLARTAVSLAAAGGDVVAPSDMMDGRVAAIRRELDDAGLEQTPILSYAAKFASAFYGPFREAAGSAPQFGDRRSYQMDGANLREALREMQLDVAEGADMLLMKPAGPYLDVIAAARERFDLPIGAYQVSGEYAMLQAAFARGWLEPERAMMESLLSIRRAGAGFIVSYFALDAARVLA
ncbi:MAG TPA: porphobilinogen synthase [Acidisarcina sp.]